VSLFSSYDYALADLRSIQILSLGIMQALRETNEADRLRRIIRTPQEVRRIIALRIVTNTFVVSFLGIMAYCIYLLVTEQVANQDSQTIAILTSLGISAISIFSPAVVSAVGWIEQYKTMDTQVKITLARAWCIKMTALMALLSSIWQQNSKLVCLAR
jgi:hypothetical protein